MPLLGQQPDPPASGAHKRGPHGPVEMLLRERQELGLTPEQVTQLEEIGRRMDALNRPLVTQLVEIRRRFQVEPGTPRSEMTPEQREAFQRALEEARPLIHQIREHNHAAMEEVRAVLTPEQRLQVREMLRERGHRKGKYHRRHDPGV